jgi:hypothetical protein
MKHVKDLIPRALSDLEKARNEYLSGIRLIQTVMHKHGLKAFKELLREAYLSAADDMEQINLDLSTAYYREAMSLFPEDEETGS